MFRFLAALTALAVFGSPGVRADHFSVQLKLQAGKRVLTAETQTDALGAMPKAREVLKLKVGERISVRWKLKNTNATKSFKDVIVHFYAVKLKEAGQKTTPGLNKDVAAETAMNMDFGPKDEASGELKFTIERAGPFLLRVQTRGAAVGVDGHEHFAALELLAEEK